MARVLQSPARPDFLQQAMAGPQRETQQVRFQFGTPGAMRPAGGLTMQRQRSPIGIQDIAARAQQDIISQRQREGVERRTAARAMGGVRQAYGQAVTGMEQRIGATQARAQKAIPEARGRAQAGFEEAQQVAEETLARTRERGEDATERAIQWREDQFAAFEGSFALRMDNLRRGLMNQYDQQLAGIDAGLAGGSITAQGGMTAGDIAGQMRVQAESQYQDQLRSLAAQVGVEESRLESQMRQTVDRYTLETIGAAQQMAATTGVAISQVMGALAPARAQMEEMFLQEQRMYELGLNELFLATQQMRVREPELAAEIMLSEAYLPDAEILYPLARELMFLYQGEEIGQPSLGQWGQGAGGIVQGEPGGPVVAGLGGQSR